MKKFYNFGRRSGCGRTNSSRIFPADSADVLVRNGSGSVLQPEGCGLTGKSVFLEKEVFLSDADSVLKEKCEFVLV
jgi:hypothetical protein